MPYEILLQHASIVSCLCVFGISHFGLYYLYSSTIQIDIVGTPVEGKDYIIGSCKYRNEKIGVDELDLIRDYASVFGKGNNYHYYIFSKGGFTDGLLQAQERGEVQLITLEDLYK